MFNVDFTLLDRSSVRAPVTDFQVGAEIVDHPSAWLDMLSVLPCIGPDDVVLVAGFDSGRSVDVRLLNTVEPVLAQQELSGKRRFTLQFSDKVRSCCAVAEFDISASADQVSVQLSLVSADELFQQDQEFAAVLAMTLPAVLSRVAVDVVAVVHRSLSLDLADTTVHLTMMVPDETYADLCTHGLSELSLLESELKESGAAFVPRIQALFANAPVEAVAKPVSTKVALTTAQRLALALNLVTFREARGLKQLDVADQALGFSKSHAAVSRLERGILSDVEAERLSKLAAFFNTSVDALLENRLTSGEPNRPEEGQGLSIFDSDCEFAPSVNFGNRLTLARTAAGLSVSALAKKLGHLNPATVQDWEAEKATPRRTSFIDLGLALAAPVSWMMFGRRVATPSRALALRLTAMQKLYGMTNGEVGALVETSNDSAALESAGRLISRLTLARHGATPSVLRALSVALQVPEDWISPPNAGSLHMREQAQKAASVKEGKGSEVSTSNLSKPALKLISDLIDLFEMGLISDADARELRGEILTRFTAAVIRPKRQTGAQAASGH